MNKEEQPNPAKELLDYYKEILLATTNDKVIDFCMIRIEEIDRMVTKEPLIMTIDPPDS